MNYCIINEPTVQFPEVEPQPAACSHIQQMSCISQTVWALTAAHRWPCHVQQCDIWGTSAAFRTLGLLDTWLQFYWTFRTNLVLLFAVVCVCVCVCARARACVCGVRACVYDRRTHPNV